MISYAQNQEDVVLFRLTEVVKNGVFVDVGAAHPILENVTYALYMHGWRGVNIEPMAREAGMLKELRPQDKTIQAAVGREAGSITLFEAPLENRGATTFDAQAVQNYRQSGQSFEEFESPVITLDSILEKFGVGEVHIVKIDVEGLEKDVILGANFSRHKPWVLVIEATKPNSQHDSSSEWESLVIAAGYTYVLFDGLNRFYVRDDLKEIQKLLSSPANVFDGWQSFQEFSSTEYAQSLESVLKARDIEIENAKIHIASLTADLATSQLLNQELNVYVQALLESIERIKA